MPEPLKIYWDSCVFLSYVQGRPLDRMPILEALVDRAYARQIHIYTSTFSIVEVAFAEEERAGELLDPAVMAKIDDFWADRRVVTLVEFHELIGRDARALIRNAIAAGRSLKPADAVHLATAVRIAAAEFHTYDNRLMSAANGLSLAMPVVRPRTDQPRLIP